MNVGGWRRHGDVSFLRVQLLIDANMGHKHITFLHKADNKIF